MERKRDVRGRAEDLEEGYEVTEVQRLEMIWKRLQDGYFQDRRSHSQG